MTLLADWLRIDQLHREAHPHPHLAPAVPDKALRARVSGARRWARRGFPSAPIPHDQLGPSPNRLLRRETDAFQKAEAERHGRSWGVPLSGRQWTKWRKQQRRAAKAVGA